MRRGWWEDRSGGSAGSSGLNHIAAVGVTACHPQSCRLPARETTAAHPAAGGELGGQVALVTGASKGIGRAIAEHLAAAGAAVALLARSVGPLEEVAGAIVARGGRALAVPADAIDRAAVERAVADAERALGPVDVLVNNAGANAVFGPLWEVDLGTWRADFETNFFGPLLCARAVLPGMVARRRGRIVNMASAAGVGSRRGFSAYGIAKTALIRPTETLAEETAEHGLTVYAVHPGRVLTPMNEGLLASPAFRRWRPDLVRAVDEGRIPWMPADPAAQLVVRLASGGADALSERYFDVETDDLDALVARADEIPERRLLTLGLAT